MSDLIRLASDHAALTDYWDTPINHNSLSRELKRIVDNTHYPSRLDRLFTALKYDASLIRETFVRRILADRLIRRYYDGRRVCGT